MKILFVCTGNSCRSAMAKAYLEKRLKDLNRKDVDVYSAGIAPFEGMEATKEAKQVIAEEGADLSEHFSKKITEFDVHQADLIFVMEEKHKKYILDKYPQALRKIYLLRDFTSIGDFTVSKDSNIADPIGRDIDFYRETFSIIKESIERILKEI